MNTATSPARLRSDRFDAHPTVAPLLAMWRTLHDAAEQSERPVDARILQAAADVYSERADDARATLAASAA